MDHKQFLFLRDVALGIKLLGHTSEQETVVDHLARLPTNDALTRSYCFGRSRMRNLLGYSICWRNLLGGCTNLKCRRFDLWSGGSCSSTKVGIISDEFDDCGFECNEGGWIIMFDSSSSTSIMSGIICWVACGFSGSRFLICGGKWA